MEAKLNKKLNVILSGEQLRSITVQMWLHCSLSIYIFRARGNCEIEIPTKMVLYYRINDREAKDKIIWFMKSKMVISL